MKIISGGQTGTDMAAIDYALALGMASGGTVPKGWRQVGSDGRETDAREYFSTHPGTFVESESRSYAARTAKNAIDSDGTLVIAEKPDSSGTAFTVRVCEKHGKPHITVIPSEFVQENDASKIGAWISANGIEVLNVAGNSEYSSPGIYGKAFAVLEGVFGKVEPR